VKEILKAFIKNCLLIQNGLNWFRSLFQPIRSVFLSSYTFLLLLIVLAFFLRLWGIWNVSTTDEYNEVLEALRVCSGHLNPERWMKRLYLYILAFEYGIYYVTGWTFGIFKDPTDFATKIVRNMEPLFFIGRVTSAIAGTLTVGILYKIGTRYFNKYSAIIASLLLVFTVFHIDLSQQAKVDALLGLLVTSMLYFVLGLLPPYTFHKATLVWCGLLFGLSVQTKINSVVLIVPLTIAIALNQTPIKTKIKYTLTFLLPSFIAGFIVGNPPVLLWPGKFFKAIMGLGSVYTTPINAVPNELIGFLAYPIYYFKSMGVTVFILTTLSLLWVPFNLNEKRAILLSFVVAFFVLMGSSQNLVGAYYMIPMIPAIFLLLGDSVDEGLNRVFTKYQVDRHKGSLLCALVLFLALIQPVIMVVYHEISLTGPNTRYIAKDWIESNIPPGSKILMDSGKSINSFAPPIAENKTSLQRILLDANENINSGKIVHGMVDTNALIYYELLFQAIPAISYDITSTMYGLELKSIDEYINKGYQYFIISKDMKENRINEYSSIHFSKTAEFYKALDIDKRIALIKSIGPTMTNRGDTFFVYKVSGN
jgi:4-amino-4-deoxy-L-arabinose transferase-like glycosyltransferase